MDKIITQSISFEGNFFEEHDGILYNMVRVLLWDIISLLYTRKTRDSNPQTLFQVAGFQNRLLTIRLSSN